MRVTKWDLAREPNHARAWEKAGKTPPTLWKAVEDSPFFLDLVKRRPALIHEINERVTGMGSKMWHSGESRHTRGWSVEAIRYSWTFMENNDARRFQRWFNRWLELHRVPS